jgi:hypothetical protein
MAIGLARLDGASHLNGAAKQQQFFSQGGFTGIRVTDDTEGTAFGDLFGQSVAQGAGPSLQIGE